MLQKLLFQRASRLNTIGASVGAFVGIALLLLSLQFYTDVQSIINRATNYVTINKKVSVLNTLSSAIGMDASGFTTADLDELKAKPFIKMVAPFRSNQFRVTATSSQLGFITEMFFQSLPKEVVDYDGMDFRWREGQEAVPIIMSYDYLALYNFAFAPSQNLPPLTAKTIGFVSFELILRGNGIEKNFTGRIVGFSRRVNSVLVPDEFLQYANSQFGEKQKPVKQVMLELDNPYSRAFSDFLTEKNYELSRGGLIGDELKALLQVVILAIFLVGLLVTALSLLVFVLNFRLTVSDAAPDIRLLLQIGYKQDTITDLLNKRFYKQFIIVFLSAILTLLVAKLGMNTWFEAQGFPLSFIPHWSVGVLALVLALAFIGFNQRSVKSSVAKLNN